MKRALCILALTVSCGTTGLPEGSGQGILSFDRTAPEGVRSHPRPAWREGDLFVYQRGGVVRATMRVESVGEASYVLRQDETGARTVLNADLGMIEVLDPAQEVVRRLDPADAWLHWPLWPGKQWSCHLLQKAAAQPMLPLVVSYHCDAIETVTVPAGTFQCLRIWRRARVATEQQQFFEKASLLWYAPEVGYFVRRLEDGKTTELLEFHRQ